MTRRPRSLRPRPLDRRAFLGRTAALGAAAAVAPWALASCASSSLRTVKRARLRHACIGVGGMGRHDLQNIGGHPDVDIVALCDVDATLLAEASALFPDARTYGDWRELLAAEHDRLDSVNVSTPDHTHAPATMIALQRGLHVYCQKPLTHTVLEARRIAEAAADARAVTQMGIQNHSNQPFRQALAVFDDGVTGPVHEVHVWTDRPSGWWAQGVGRPEGGDPVPETLDWDGWLGVAPERPYKEGAYHTFQWRGRKDFGTGAQGDMACHLMDPVPWFLGVRSPVDVRSVGPKPNDESFPEWSEVHYTFDAASDACAEDGVHVVWHDGARKPDALLEEWGIAEPYANAALFVGATGALLASPYEPCRLFVRGGERRLNLTDVPPIDHWHQFVEACFGREPPRTPFDYSAPLTEIALLGNVALEFPGETLAWDGPRLLFPERGDATALVHKDYRAGWEVPGL